MRPLSPAIIVLCLAACGPSKADRLRAKAASDLQCNTELSIQEQGVYVEAVTGCGKEMIYAYDHGGKAWVSPLDRAAFDLGCKLEELVTKKLDAKSVGVVCGDNRAVYVLVQNLVTGAAQWVMNSTTEVASGSKQGQAEDAEAPAAPVPETDGE
jgi:hypothetical protein